MTKHEFHNALRIILNLEGEELDFLTDVQRDNFYANPHMFFVRCDDATADKIWALVVPQQRPTPPAQSGKVVDLSKWRDEVRKPGIPARSGAWVQTWGNDWQSLHNAG
jgi:hypothetical protein